MDLISKPKQKEYTVNGSDRTQEYLAHALLLSEKECIVRDFYEEWLPHNIFDVHAHANRAEDVEKLPEMIQNRPLSTFPAYTLDDSRRMTELFHPSKHITHLRFAQPYKGINWRGANTYLQENLGSSDLMALCGDPLDPQYTITQLADQRVSALKMYYFFTTPPVKTIYGYFTPEILAEAELLQKPIILHPPVPLPECMDQFKTLMNDFPNLRVIIAHLGLYSEPVDRFRKAFEELAIYPGIYADTSMCHSPELVQIGLETLGPDRIMYGSDQPISLIRAIQFFDHERNRPVLLPDYRYHWVRDEDWNQYNGLYHDISHGHWANLDAIRHTIEKHPLIENQLKQKIFYENAAALFSI